MNQNCEEEREGREKKTKSSHKLLNVKYYFYLIKLKQRLKRCCLIKILIFFFHPNEEKKVKHFLSLHQSKKWFMHL